MDNQFRITDPEVVRKEIVIVSRVSVEADGGLAISYVIGGETKNVKIENANLSQAALNAIAALNAEVFAALVLHGAIGAGVEEPVGTP